jgi:hypothetical protein
MTTERPEPQQQPEVQQFVPSNPLAEGAQAELQHFAPHATADTNIFCEQARALAYFADVDKSGTMSKDELIDYRNNQEDPKMVDFSNFLLKNFNDLATLANNNLPEMRDFRLEQLTRKAFHDPSPDSEISARDLQVAYNLMANKNPGRDAQEAMDKAYSDPYSVQMGYISPRQRFLDLEIRHDEKRVTMLKMFRDHHEAKRTGL